MQDNIKEKLTVLVDRFRSNIDTYKSGMYDEANVRIDFIDPFFELLGWDVRNLQGNSEKYRDVVREDKVVIEGKPKAPDYSFRLGGNRVFFVEAKKPAINIKEAASPAYQLRRYAYTAEMPLSILTDFEEFAVYDTRIKPRQDDKSSVCRVFYYKYDEFLANWGFIQGTFSKTAVQQGSFDKFAADTKNKKGTGKVDQEILALIESWRHDLAKNIALRNSHLDIYALNSAVSRIIDRIVFLRIAEDRYIEKYGLLLENATYARLNDIFVLANEKYNAGLFRTEELFQKLIIDDKLLLGIIKQLYYPVCPYEFSVLPIEILGSIYEQFLGKTIRLTNGHRAIVEEKPEVRKAGGVYYTPQYIVDYIIEQTVGTKCDGKTPEQVAKLKILDPACGSGSFLVGAYNFLLDWHLAYYTKPENIAKSKKAEKLYDTSQSAYKLTIEEKQRILCNNIFGVDIDAQVTEVTKLSLYLKLLEDETVEAKRELFKHSDFKLLPNLDANIQCGNSLIESDFYDDKQMSLFGEHELRRINVFDWKKAFPNIFKNGGFDFVFGNPPWGQKAIKFSDDEKVYYAKKYPASTVGIHEQSRYFIEKSIILLKEDGQWGQVLPDIILLKNYETSRKFILDNLALTSIDHWGFSFSQVNLEACTMTGIKCKPPLTNTIRIQIRNKDGSVKKSNINQSVFLGLRDYKFNLHLDETSTTLIEKISTNGNFGDFFNTHEGIHTGNVRAKLFIDSNFNSKCRKLIFGRKEMQRYELHWDGGWVHYDKSILCKNEYAGLGKPEYFENPKLVIRRTGDYVLANIDENGFYFSNNVFVCNPLERNLDLRAFLGILNSNLITWYYRQMQPRVGKAFAELKINLIKKIPMPFCIDNMEKHKKQLDKISLLVKDMLTAKQEAIASKDTSRHPFMQQKVEAIDRQIDQSVYELYGLSATEVSLVDQYHDRRKFLYAM